MSRGNCEGGEVRLWRGGVDGVGNDDQHNSASWQITSTVPLFKDVS